MKKQTIYEQLRKIEERLSAAEEYVARNENIESSSFLHFKDWDGKSGHPLWMKNFMIPTTKKGRSRIERALERIDAKEREKNFQEIRKSKAGRIARRAKKLNGAIAMTTLATTAEERLAKLDIHLPEPPTPFGAYVPAVQTGNLLFLSGMITTSGHKAAMTGILGKQLDIKAGQAAARIAALNGIALTRKTLGSLNRVSRVVRLGIYVAATPEFVDHAQVADGASELFRDVFGEATVSSRIVYGVASIPLGSPVLVEIILEITP